MGGTKGEGSACIANRDSPGATKEHRVRGHRDLASSGDAHSVGRGLFEAGFARGVFVAVGHAVRAHCHLTSASLTPRPARKLSRACSTRRRNRGSFSSR